MPYKTDQYKKSRNNDDDTFDSNQRTKNLGRRAIIGKAVELGSILPLGFLLAQNFKAGGEYWDVDTSRALVAEKPGNIARMHNNSLTLGKSLDNLWSSYKSAYHNSHLERYMGTDSEGNMVTKYRTVWRWEEPRNVPDHTRISAWQSEQNELSAKTNYLSQGELIDGERLKEVTVEPRESGEVGRGILNTTIYGTGISLLLGYEEIEAFAKAKDSRQSFKDTFKELNSRGEIERRAVFKVLAGGAATGAVYLLRDHNVKKVAQSRIDLTNVVDDAGSLLEMSSGSGFTKYFGATPGQMRQDIGEVVATSKATLRNGVSNARVKGSFSNVIRSGENCLNNWDRLFVDGEIPQDLGEIAKLGYVSKVIEKGVAAKRVSPGANLLIEGLAVGGTMAAILIPFEMWQHGMISFGKKKNSSY